MSESTVQLRIWMNFDTNEEEEDRVDDLLRNYGFSIATTWEPEGNDLEYQTQTFVDSESNQDAIQELKSALTSEFTDETVSSSTDMGSHHIRDKPYEGVYHIQIKK